MKNAFTLSMLVIGMLYSYLSTAQLAINELSTTGEIEIINTSNDVIDVSSFWLCDRPSYEQIGNLDVVCGSTALEPGQTVTITSNAINISGSGDELALYTNTNFGSSDAIVDYVIWGDRTGSTREPVAVSAGIWTADERAPDFTAASTLNWDGENNGANAWMVSDASICVDEGTPPDEGCQADGGTLTGGPFTFEAVGDGTADNIPAGAITSADTNGDEIRWVVTDDEGYILGLPPMPSAVNFDTPGSGSCFIWRLATVGEVSGIGMGLNTNNLQGCFSLSNPVEVIRINASGCQANGGELFGGPFTFDAVGDGTPDNIPEGAITTVNTNGDEIRWVVTDDQGYILGLPPTPSAVNFDTPGSVHASYGDWLL